MAKRWMVSGFWRAARVGLVIVSMALPTVGHTQTVSEDARDVAELLSRIDALVDARDGLVHEQTNIDRQQQAQSTRAGALSAAVSDLNQRQAALEVEERELQGEIEEFNAYCNTSLLGTVTEIRQGWCAANADRLLARRGDFEARRKVLSEDFTDHNQQVLLLDEEQRALAQQAAALEQRYQDVIVRMAAAKDALYGSAFAQRHQDCLTKPTDEETDNCLQAAVDSALAQ